MADDAARKAREEYLKKYLTKDEKSIKKQKRKKKKNVDTGLIIHEEDAFAAVAPCMGRISSDDESEKDVQILKKITTNEKPKFKRATFEAVEIKTECDVVRERHDTSDDSDVPDDTVVPSTSANIIKGSALTQNQRTTMQILNKQTSIDSDASLVRGIKDEPPDSFASSPKRLIGSKNSSAKRLREEDSDVSPPRQKKVAAYDSDNSPPRRRTEMRSSRRDRESKHSSHRKRRRSDDTGSFRRKNSHDLDSDISPPRNSTMIKTKRIHHGRSDDSFCGQHHESRGERKHMNGGTKDNIEDRTDEKDSKAVLAGRNALKTLEEHREEMKKFKEDEAKMLEKWEEFGTGKDAVAIHRAKMMGKGRETKENRERKEREAKKQQELEEKYMKWNKGLRQIEERSEKLNEMARVAMEDFARHANDEAMNEHMKMQLHEKDPMIKYMKKKKENKEIKSGTVYPKYKGSWPPNRFNIAPGYRWDGVNRSNGFEDKIAETANRKAAQRTEYYENIAKYEV